MVLRVLLIADDPALQRAVRQVFDPQQREWELHVSRGGQEALARLDGPGFDAFVTDSRLTGTDCTELLTEVRRRQPLTTRIALSDPGDQAALVRLGSLAHRVLAKPCDPTELRGAIHRARSLRELLGSPSLVAVVNRLGSVPALSTLYTRIAEELTFPDYSLATVGELVGQDIGIAAKLLQMANSALVGLRRPATTPVQAVKILGADLTRSLVLAADLFSRYNPNLLKPFSIEALWEHSQAVGTLANEITTMERADERVVREATLSGLFHDIGKLTLASQLPGPFREVLTLIRTEKLTAADAERRVLGTSHAEVGAYLLGLWGLPDALVEAIAWHHNPSGCPGTKFTALTAVHAADCILRGPEGIVPDWEYLTRLGLHERYALWSRIPETRAKESK
jgi:putative nucleotidyltransferase with HDIG domain